jgi:plastocyanin
MRRIMTLSRIAWPMFALLPVHVAAQAPATETSEVHAQIQLPAALRKDHLPAAVVWLDAEDKSSVVHSMAPGHFTLLQKNRMFSPHLLVIPTGSVVSFPNADPFFHNVFSFFNGKRFDLGLYEAGTSKEVVFSREGVSYIFCNIHPEMSAVVLALATPLYGVADASEKVTIHDVPPGGYYLHVWVEGFMQPALDRMTRRVEIRHGAANNLVLDATGAPRQPAQHLNKFGRPYDRDTRPPY